MRNIYRIFYLLILTGGVLTVQISAKTPVLVELFTSQGCPTCPQADKVLADLETSQPISDAEIITLVVAR